MPAVSQAQRAFLFATKGAAWVKAHHYDNKGPLPQFVSSLSGKAPRKRKQGAK